MNKKIIALLLSLVMLLSQSNICFGEVAEAIIFDFSTDISAMVSAKKIYTNVTYSAGVNETECTIKSGQLIYMYLDDIDGSTYDTMKIEIQCKSVPQSPYMSIYYRGVKKTDSSALDQAESRKHNEYHKNLILNNETQTYYNNEYETYYIDLSKITSWSDANINLVRLEPLKNMEGTVCIRNISFYKKEITGIDAEPDSITVPYVYQNDILSYVKNQITSVKHVYNNGSKIDIDGEYNVSISEDNSIATVAYDGMTDTVDIVLATPANLESITVSPTEITLPYDNQSTTQLMESYIRSKIENVTALYDDNTSVNIADYNIIIKDNTATVSYGKKTSDINLILAPPPAENVIYDFKETTEGFEKKDGDVTLSVENESLKYVSVAKETNGSKTYGNMVKDVNYDINQFYKMEIKVKVDGVTPTASGGKPEFMFYYAGRDSRGNGYDSFVSTNYFKGWYDAKIKDDGKYYSDWQTVTVDLSSSNAWKTYKVSKLRFDAINKAEGTIYIDYIKFYSVPAITNFAFDGVEDINEAVPSETKTITAVLSQKLYEIKDDAIRIYDSDNVDVNIKSVKYDADKNTVTVEVDKLETFTEYTFEINKNAKVNSVQNLYKPTMAKFKTIPSSFEFDAVGDGDSVYLSFSNQRSSPKNIVLIATVWEGDKYVGKKVLSYTVQTGDENYTFDYSSVTGGNKAEVTVWEFSSGTIKKVHGKKVYSFER